MATGRVFVDFNRDGTFAAGDEVTADLRMIGWTRGRSADFKKEAQGSAEFVLNNELGQYNTTLAPGMPVTIRSTHLAVDRAHFYGFIQRISYDTKARVASVTCYDPLRRMGDTDCEIVATAIPHSAHELRVAVLGVYEGRSANKCKNGGFDGAVTTGWKSIPSNLVANGNFESDTTGWVTTADSFHATGGTLTRQTAGPKIGSGYGRLQTPAGTADGVHVVLPGTYTGGHTYRVLGWLKVEGAGSPYSAASHFIIGSNGTPSDKAETGSVNFDALGGGTWEAVSVDWIPSSNRTDAHLALYVNNTAPSTIAYTSLDGVTVFDITTMWGPTRPTDWFDTFGVLAAGTEPEPVAITTTDAQRKWGSRSLNYTTPAKTGSGIYYDFGEQGEAFTQGVSHSVSVWLRATTAMPYRIGLTRYDATTHTWEALNQATGTLTANTWAVITFTLTPSAGHTSGIVLYSQQTNATARTVYLDGVRVAEGAAIDYESAAWSLIDLESDTYLASASLSGSVLACLETLNELTLSRHFIRPSLTSPFFSYVVTSRDSLAAKVSSETFTDDFADFSPLDLDIDAIYNVIPVNYSGGTISYLNGTSRALYGERLSQVIDGNSFFPDITIPNIVGPFILNRYATPRARPEMTVRDKFTTVLVRDLDDVVTITLAQAGISARKYLIVRVEMEVTRSSNRWVARYALEEFPY